MSSRSNTGRAMRWVMRNSIRLPCLVAAIVLVLGCERDSIEPTPMARPDAVDHAESRPAEIERAKTTNELRGDHVGDRYPASLESVVEKRFLRVLTSQNAFDFYLHRGQRGGYQYEMVEAFTRFLNQRHAPGRNELPIQFELIPVHSDQMIPLLLEGAADMIAARLTITPERAALVRFSRPYRSVDELLVSHDRMPPLGAIEELGGRTVAVRASSSYHESLQSLDSAFQEAGLPPMDLVSVDESLETERILELVAARRFSYTVADSIVAKLALEAHPQLRIAEGVALRRDGKLAWATQTSAIGLAQEMNAFLERYEEGSLLGNIAIAKYFEAENELANRLADGGTATLSAYDDLFKRHAAQFGLDWRLVAATAYQESRFDPAAHNRWGAVGLMQIKPSTAREPYVDIPLVEGPEHVSDNVKAGVKYLSWIKKRYFDAEADMRERDRIRMALAAYNAGPGAIINARRRARKLGLDPNRWFRHVELALLDMRKMEPVKYVSEINQRYLAYVMLGVK
jgi:membrane-bound lytic murein transglycosylase MltF